MNWRICQRCGEDAEGFREGDCELIVCKTCGFTDRNYQSGYDDGWQPKQLAHGVDDDEDFDEDEDLPDEWWEDDDE